VSFPPRPAPRTRVVHVITRLILGGAQENTLLTVEGLDRMPGYDVTLVTGPALGPEGELVSRARASGVDLVLVDAMRREIHPWRDLVSFVQLFAILRRRRPHIVHTHSSKAGVLGRIAARLAGVPVVIHTIHGLPFHPYQSRARNAFFRLCEKVCARMADVIVTVADAMTAQAVAAGVGTRRRFRTIYSGFELDAYAPSPEARAATRRALGIPPGAPVVGKVARLAPLKGHEFLLAAAPHIAEAVPDVRFLLVGDGVLRDEIEAAAARAGLRDRFVLTGMVDRDRVPDYLAAMDVVVHASLREGLPRVLPQAVIADRPVVAYDVDGSREVVEDGRTGFLLPPREVPGLADRVIRLLRDDRLSRRLAAEGRRLAESRFSAETMVAKIDALYREILHKRHQSRKTT
jgi:glycosyltransferase involved in cell wall biosynthesis